MVYINPKYSEELNKKAKLGIRPTDPRHFEAYNYLRNQYTSVQPVATQPIVITGGSNPPTNNTRTTSGGSTVPTTVPTFTSIPVVQNAGSSLNPDSLMAIGVLVIGVKLITSFFK